MKNKMVFLISAILLLMPFAFAQEDFSYNNFDDFINDLPTINEYLVENEILLPSSAGFLIKNGDIDVNVSRQDFREEFHITFEDKRLSKISARPSENSEYVILADEETINDIIASEDVANEILSAYDNGKIEIKAVGFGNKIKLFFGKIIFSIFG